MLASILLAGTCAWMPDFSDDGPTCSAANEDVECRCSECFTWDASSSSDLARYDIQRISEDGTTSVWSLYGQSYYEDGQSHDIAAPTVYCPAKHDGRMPLEGRLYRFRVRACDTTGNCSDWSEEHHYRAAPYWVDVFNGPAGNLP